ncbi:MAG TPA: HAMP domain-containing sensor histidine kinase [Chthoniobacteraceae bacterium]|jgi:signal transduction histidine kinase|nr:HAMP domain-containing sensor histidine kinase [Chthoniobacteraceae bacterium]
MFVEFTMPPESPALAIDFAPLIRAALEVVPDDEVGGMTRLMRAVAKATGSFGACLWRKRTTKDEFLMLAGWYQDEKRITLSRMATSGTCARRAMETGECVDQDLVASGNPNAYHPFLVTRGINRTIACKVEVKRSSDEKDDGWTGSLNLYRRGPRPDSKPGAVDDGAFTPEQLETLKTICGSIPLLFRATRDHDALELFRKTEEIIASHAPPSNAAEWEDCLRQTISRFGTVLQRAFRSLELSIFLRRKEDPRFYRCWFTTKGRHERVTQKFYRHEAMDEGFSGLCLLVDEAIRIADIRHPEDEVVEWQRRFPTFEGHKSQGVSGETLEEEGLSDQEAPPHSMMYARLAAGEEIFGFVRCRIRQYGPVTYHGEDAELLYMVCQSFSQNLAAWWEAHHWDELEEGAPAEPKYEVLLHDKQRNQHLAKALDLIDHLIPGADINTSRMLDSTGKNLIFAAASVDAMKELKDPTGLTETFPLGDVLETNGAALVFNSKRTQRFTAADSRINISFRRVKELIIAPIKDHKETIYGVLDARSKSAFPPYAGRLMGIIGRLVGMQHAHLLEDEKNRAHAAEIARKDEEKRRATLDAMRKEVEDERRTVQAFEDAAHQIKTPLNAARKLVEISNSYRLPMDIGLLETSLRRADLASKLINTFADIASGREPHLKKEDLLAEELVNLLLLLSSDVARSSLEERFLKFEVLDHSILRHAPDVLTVDKDLIAEAIYNLLDNAEKYSHVRGAVRIFGTRSRTGKFNLAITNRGERIEPGEEGKCLERRWRGPRLAGKTGSGSGLGLYIVDRIMKAHSGRVVVVPTDKEGTTEIRLEF